MTTGSTGTGVEVRVAALDDLAARTAYELMRLRQDVFVVEQQCAYPDLDGRDAEPTTRHVLMLGPGTGAVIGCARVLEDADGLRVGRVALAREARGRGLADLLLRTALDLVDAQGRASVLDAQAPLAGWYATFGYTVDGPEFLEGGIPHVPMRRPAGGDR